MSTDIRYWGIVISSRSAYHAHGAVVRFDEGSDRCGQSALVRQAGKAYQRDMQISLRDLGSSVPRLGLFWKCLTLPRDSARRSIPVRATIPRRRDGSRPQTADRGKKFIAPLHTLIEAPFSPSYCPRDIMKSSVRDCPPPP